MPKDAPITDIKARKQWFTTRDLLWYLVFFGFAVNYMIRLNLNIAIVSMVKNRPNNISLTSECIVPTETIVSITKTNFTTVNTSFVTNITDIKSILQNLPKSTSPTFEWDEKQQGFLLATFFYLHWTTQIPGGLLAGKYGTKLVFGLSNFIGVGLCFFMPLAASLGYYYLVALRLIQGTIMGMAWPAMHNMTAQWIPPNERSKFVTAYMGSSIGAALTYFCCGFVIHWWGWEWVFYVCGIAGTLWFMFWWALVYDSPAVHPRISKQEREYILGSLGTSVSIKKAPVPWLRLLTSLPVWMNVIAHMGSIWGLFLLITYAPIFFKFIYGLDIKATGFLSALPQVLRLVVAYIISKIGDYLLKSNKLARTNVRKIAAAISTVGQAVTMLILSFSGCNSTFAFVFLAASAAINGACSTGQLSSVVDISPNYASVIMGLVNSMAAVVGFVVPLVVGAFTYQNQTIEQWQKVFWLSCGILTLSGSLYVLFSSSELQEWNSMPTKEEHAAELEKLNTIKDEKILNDQTLELNDKLYLQNENKNNT